MKLRIRGNSVRLRLTQKEVAQFDRTGKVEEEIDFGASQTLIYALEKTERSDAVSVDFENSRLRVRVPEKAAREWIESDQTGLEAAPKVGENKCLRILIEKDFACLKERPGEDDGDAFPNPLEGAKC